MIKINPSRILGHGYYLLKFVSNLHYIPLRYIHLFCYMPPSHAAANLTVAFILNLQPQWKINYFRKNYNIFSFKFQRIFSFIKNVVFELLRNETFQLLFGKLCYIHIYKKLQITKFW